MPSAARMWRHQDQRLHLLNPLSTLRRRPLARSPRILPPPATPRRSTRRRRPASRTTPPHSPPSRCRRRGWQRAATALPCRDALAHERVHLLRLRRRRRACPCRSPTPARTRRPPPSSSALPASRAARPAAARPPLPCAPASRSSSVSPTQRIGVSPAPARRGELLRHHRVGLAEERAALRMPDDRVAAAELRQHRRRTLPRYRRPCRSGSRPGRPRRSPSPAAARWPAPDRERARRPRMPPGCRNLPEERSQERLVRRGFH